MRVFIFPSAVHKDNGKRPALTKRLRLEPPVRWPGGIWHQEDPAEQMLAIEVKQPEMGNELSPQWGDAPECYPRFTCCRLP
jgi:hypothetical protein